MLSEKVVCDCGAEWPVSADEVLTFETAECPACGTDVCFEEWLYEEALIMAEDVTCNNDV